MCALAIVSCCEASPSKTCRLKPSASWCSRGCVRRQIMPQAAPSSDQSLGQPAAGSDLGRNARFFDAGAPTSRRRSRHTQTRAVTPPPSERCRAPSRPCARRTTAGGCNSTRARDLCAVGRVDGAVFQRNPLEGASPRPLRSRRSSARSWKTAPSICSWRGSRSCVERLDSPNSHDDDGFGAPSSARLMQVIN